MERCELQGDTGLCPRPLETSNEFLSKKWTMSIVIALGNIGEVRFNDLKDKLEGVSSKVLSDRLDVLKREGLVDRSEHGEVPRRVTYQLTDKGSALYDALLPLTRWAENRASL